MHAYIHIFYFLRFLYIQVNVIGKYTIFKMNSLKCLDVETCILYNLYNRFTLHGPVIFTFFYVFFLVSVLNTPHIITYTSRYINLI